jgi:hypothetical protein
MSYNGRLFANGFFPATALLVLSCLIQSETLFAQTPEPTQNASKSGPGNYSISNAGENTFLIDSNSGATWLLFRSVDGKAAWMPLPLFKLEKDFEDWRKTAGAPIPAGKKETTAAGLKPILEKMGYQCLPMQRLKSGFLCLHVTLNGKKLFVAVDTGAPNTHLDRRQVSQHKFDWQRIRRQAEDGSSVEAMILSASGLDVSGFRTGPLTVVEQDLSTINERLAGFKDPFIDGVLGSDVLDRHLAVIDYVGCNLFLLKRGSTPD